MPRALLSPPLLAQGRWHWRASARRAPQTVSPCPPQASHARARVQTRQTHAHMRSRTRTRRPAHAPHTHTHQRSCTQPTVGQRPRTHATRTRAHVLARDAMMMTGPAAASSFSAYKMRASCVPCARCVCACVRVGGRQGAACVCARATVAHLGAGLAPLLVCLPG